MFRKEGRGCASIEDWVDASIWGLEDYIKNSKNGLITAASNKWQHKDKQQKQKWEEKQLYGYFDKLVKSLTKRPGHGYESLLIAA